MGQKPAATGSPTAADAAKPLRGCRRPVATSVVLAGFSKPWRMMSPCPLFPSIATISAIWPSMLDKGGVLYRHIEICEQGGRVRRLTIVRAIEALALLIEQHAVGMFLFWERQGECWLWCVDRADGPQQVDFEAMRAYVQQRGCANAP